MSVQNMKGKRYKKKNRSSKSGNKRAYQKPVVPEVEIPGVERDDFTKIDGIDARIEYALSSLEIFKYEQLAQYAPPELSKELMERTGVLVSAAIIRSQDWMGAANLLSHSREQEQPAETASREKVSGSKPAREGGAKTGSRAGLADTRVKDVAAPESKSSTGAETKVPSKQAKPMPETSDPVPPSKAIGDEPAGVAASEVAASGGSAPQEPSESTKAKPVSESIGQIENSGDEAKAKVSGKRIDRERPRTAATMSSGPLPESNKEKDVDAAVRALALEITGVRLASSNGGGRNKLAHDNALGGEIDCEISGRNASVLAMARKPLTAQVHAVNLTSGQSELLCSRSLCLQPDRTVYRIPLRFKVTANAGRYRLQVYAFIQHDEPEIDWHQGPILNVEN
ncbi:MAG: hypothetical protein ACE5IY_05195 [bacterium]